MTIPMDNTLDNSLRERVQRLYNKNVELETRRRKAAQARIPSDPNTWQQMRENYETIILEDHAFSEQHEIEYTLWQLHYRRIEELRSHYNAASASPGANAPQNGKGPTRSGPDRLTKIRTQFKTFLSEATGFYHDLMLKIRAKYGLPLGYFSDDSDCQNHQGDRSKKGLISCHRCLIYLGDLARYKGLYGEGDSKAQDFAAASSYYMQATSLWPSSGNPHHQLAIVASYSGDELVAIYRYFRSLAVDSPFTTARDNLIIAFEKNRQSFTQLVGESKGSTAKPARPTGRGRGKGEIRAASKDNKLEASSTVESASSTAEIFKVFGVRFVRLNGLLFTRTSLETYGDIFSMVKGDLLELLSSGQEEVYNFGSDATDCRLAVVRMVAILVFTIHNVSRETENQSYAEILQRSVLLQNAFTATFELMGHILKRCSQLNDLSESYLLPGIMVFVEWLACHQDVAIGSDVEEKQAHARLFFWNHCINFFNRLISSGHMFIDEDEDEKCFTNMSKYDGEVGNRLALPEDFELRGFVPLLPAQLILDFSRKHSFGMDGDKEKKARIQRIIAAGKVLANVVRVGEDGIYFNTKVRKFAIGVKPLVSEDYSLSTPLEAPHPNGIEKEKAVAGQMTLRTLEPKLQSYVEDEEEDDEVIVFKPPITEKHVEGMVTITNPASSEVFANVARTDIESEVGHLSSGLDGFLIPNSYSSGLRSPTSFGVSSSLYMQPGHVTKSTWMQEQESLVNGLGNLNLFDNGLVMQSESQNIFGAFQPQPLPTSLPDPGFNVGSVSTYPVHLQETVVPSKFDSIMSLGADNISMKGSSLSPEGFKKNPVGRPVRHLGPPPGFGSTPSKTVDESFPPALSFKNENNALPPMDDYSWRDGYQLPFVNRSVGFTGYVNSSGQGYNTANKSSNAMGALNFPFPGKQTTAQVPGENQTSRQEYQLSEQMRIYQEQQQQLKKGNQQPTGLPQQYQGQSLWEGRFFV